VARSDRLPRRSPELAWLVTGPLVILTLGIAVSIGLRSLHPWGNWPLALGFLALFIVADLSTLTFEVRRQTFTLTLVEIPLLLGLFYLAPLTLSRCASSRPWSYRYAAPRRR